MINFTSYLEKVLIKQDNTYQIITSIIEDPSITRWVITETTEEERAKGCRDEKIVHKTIFRHYVFKNNKEIEYNLPSIEDASTWIMHTIGVLDFILEGEHMFKYLIRSELKDALINQKSLADYDVIILKRTCIILDFLTSIRDKVYKESYAREITNEDRNIFASYLRNNEV